MKIAIPFIDFNINELLQNENKNAEDIKLDKYFKDFLMEKFYDEKYNDLVNEKKLCHNILCKINDTDNEFYIPSTQSILFNYYQINKICICNLIRQLCYRHRINIDQKYTLGYFWSILKRETIPFFTIPKFINIIDIYGLLILLIIINSENLKYATLRMKSTPEIIKYAVKNNGLTLEYACASLRENVDIVKLAVNNNGLALEFALQQTKEIVILAVTNNGDALYHTGIHLKYNLEIIKLAWLQNPRSILYVITDEYSKDNKSIIINTNFIISLFKMQFNTNDINVIKETMIKRIKYIFVEPAMQFYFSKNHQYEIIYAKQLKLI